MKDVNRTSLEHFQTFDFVIVNQLSDDDSVWKKQAGTLKQEFRGSLIV